MKLVTFLLRLPFDDRESFATISEKHYLPVPTLLFPVRFIGVEAAEVSVASPIALVPESSCLSLIIVGLAIVAFKVRRNRG